MTDQARALVLLDEIVAECCALLQDNLLGVYLHGSLAFGCFSWTTGDIDFLLVVQRKLTQREKESLITYLLAAEEKAPEKGLEMSVMLESHCRHFTHPAPYELHYSRAHRAAYQANLREHCEKLQGTDADLAAHVTVLHAAGKALYGPAVQNVFGPVKARDYFDSIWYDVQNTLEDVLENPVYVTLNLCRVLGYVLEGRVLSKQDGGVWALKHVPICYHEIIRSALRCYQGEQAVIDSAGAQAFAAYALRIIQQYNAK